MAFGDKLAEYIKEYDIGGDFSNVLAEAASSATVIGTAAGVGFLFGGPVGAIVGGLIGGVAEVTKLIALYKTDDEFKKEVDALFARIKGAYEAILNSVTDAVNSIIDPIARYFTFSGAERETLRDLNPELLKQIEDNEARIDELKKERIANASNFQKRQEIQTELDKLEDETGDLKDKAEALVEGKAPGLETFVPETLTENRQKVLSIQDTAERIAIELGKSPAEAAAIQQRVSRRMSNSLTPEKTGELTLARELGFGNDIEKLQARIAEMESRGTTQVVDASQSSGDTNVVTSNTNISGSGPAVDQSSLVRNSQTATRNPHY